MAAAAISDRSRTPANVAIGYDGFVQALVDRRHDLGWSQLELDERAGFQSGYTAKLEAWRGPQGRVAGSVTMPLWLQALGVGIVVVPLLDGSIDDQATVLSDVRPPPRLVLADHNKRIPKKTRRHR